MEQTALMPDAAPEFTQVSLCGKQDSRATPAAVLHTGTVTVELFEDTSRELLEAVLKAVQSCQETSPGWKRSICAPGTQIYENSWTAWWISSSTAFSLILTAIPGSSSAENVLTGSRQSTMKGTVSAFSISATKTAV